MLRQIETALCELADSSFEREISLLNLHKIRRAVVRLDLVL